MFKFLPVVITDTLQIRLEEYWDMIIYSEMLCGLIKTRGCPMCVCLVHCTLQCSISKAVLGTLIFYVCSYVAGMKLPGL